MRKISFHHGSSREAVPKPGIGMRRNYEFLAILCGLAMAVLFLAIHLFTL
jgi:hypothetical protein